MLEVELKSFEGAGQDELPPLDCLAAKRWLCEKAAEVATQERRLVPRKSEMQENRMVNFTKQIRRR